MLGWSSAHRNEAAGRRAGDAAGTLRIRAQARYAGSHEAGSALPPSRQEALITEARRIPEATVARLPLYYRALLETADHEIGTVSSQRLAELAGVNAAKVRKDLSYLGSYGTRGVGYDVAHLLHEISRELGLTHDWPVVIVGRRQPGSRARQLPALRGPRATAWWRWSMPIPTKIGRTRRRAAHRAARGAAGDRPHPGGGDRHHRHAGPRRPGGGRPARRRRDHLDPELRPHGGRRRRRGSRCARSTSRSSCRSSPSTSSAATPPRCSNRAPRRPRDDRYGPDLRRRIRSAGAHRLPGEPGGRGPSLRGRGRGAHRGPQGGVAARGRRRGRGGGAHRRRPGAGLGRRGPDHAARAGVRARRPRRGLARRPPPPATRPSTGRWPRPPRPRRVWCNAADDPRTVLVQRRVGPAAGGPRGHGGHRRAQPRPGRLAAAAPGATRSGPEYATLVDLLAAARDATAEEGRATEDADWQSALDSGMLDLIRAGRVDEAEELLRACLWS